MKKNQYHIDVTPEEGMLFRDAIETEAPVARHKMFNLPIVTGIVLVHFAGAAALFGTSLKKDTESIPSATPTPATVAATPTPAPTPVEKVSPSASPQITQSPPQTSPPKGGEVPHPSSKTTSYTVKQGDTFYSIVKRYKLSAKALTELNDIKDPSKIRVGQVLKFVK